MKSLIIASTIAIGLACAGSISASQDQTQVTNLQNLTVTAPIGQYEAYVIDLHTGFGFAALVGNTYNQYLQAQKAADRSEALRKMGRAQQPLVAVAIDNSEGPGVAKRFLMSDANQNTVAIVDVYCRRSPSLSGKRCWMYSRGPGLSSGQHVASVTTLRVVSSHV